MWNKGISSSPALPLVRWSWGIFIPTSHNPDCTYSFNFTQWKGGAEEKISSPSQGPGEWLSHLPWRYLKDAWMCTLGARFSGRTWAVLAGGWTRWSSRLFQPSPPCQKWTTKDHGTEICRQVITDKTSFSKLPWVIRQAFFLAREGWVLYQCLQLCWGPSNSALLPGLLARFSPCTVELLLWCLWIWGVCFFSPWFFFFSNTF